MRYGVVVLSAPEPFVFIQVHPELRGLAPEHHQPVQVALLRPAPDQLCRSPDRTSGRSEASACPDLASGEVGRFWGSFGECRHQEELF